MAIEFVEACPACAQAGGTCPECARLLALVAALQRPLPPDNTRAMAVLEALNLGRVA